MQEAAKGKAPISIRNLLFATDLSYASAPAMPYVLEIAGVYGAKINIVHVQTGELSNEQERETDRLKELVKGVPHEFMVVSGGPTALRERGEAATAILSLATTKNIDLIVVGTHGRTGLGRVLVGSVAETIFREAPCPVLTVGPRLMGDPKWSMKIREVLFATDLTPCSEAALPYAVSLAQQNRARLIILNVFPKSGDAAEIERQASAARQSLEALVPQEAGLWRQPYCIAEPGDPADKILDVAGGYKPELIVLGVRPHAVGMATHLSRPTAHRVIAGAACPVLTVRG
jgi:nucleotide-binding universal stress UspA family protein